MLGGVLGNVDLIRCPFPLVCWHSLAESMNAAQFTELGDGASATQRPARVLSEFEPTLIPTTIAIGYLVRQV